MADGGIALARLFAAQAASAVLFGWRADKFNDGRPGGGRQGVRQESDTDKANPIFKKPARRGGPSCV